jgi:hypothetical protein
LIASCGIATMPDAMTGRAQNDDILGGIVTLI